MNKYLIEKIMEDIEKYENINGFLMIGGIKQILTKHLSDKVIVEKKVLEDIIEEVSATKIILEGHGIPYANGYNDGYREGLKSLLANQE